MKTYMKVLAGAVSALGLVASMSASAISVDGVTWNVGDVSINGGYGGAFFAKDATTPVETGTVATGINYNMSASSIFRGAAGVQPNPPTFIPPLKADTNISTTNGLHAFGQITAFGGPAPTSDLFYIFKDASINSLSGSLVSGGSKGQVGGALSSFEILIYALPTGTLQGGDKTSCDTAKATTGTGPTSNCQAFLDSAQAAVTGGAGKLFLQLATVNQSPGVAFAQWQVTQTGFSPSNPGGFEATQSLSFDTSFFDVIGGDAAPYFQTQKFQITATTFADMQQAATSTLNAGTTTSPQIYNFNLGLQSVSIPEPGTLALLGLGLMGAAFAGRRRRQVA